MYTNNCYQHEIEKDIKPDVVSQQEIDEFNSKQCGNIVSSENEPSSLEMSMQQHTFPKIDMLQIYPETQHGLH